MNGGHVAIEAGALGRQVLAAARRQRVVARPAVVVGRGPLGFDVVVEEQPLQRWIERALANLQDVIRQLPLPLRDAVPVQRLAVQHPEDQHVQRARQDLSR